VSSGQEKRGVLSRGRRGQLVIATGERTFYRVADARDFAPPGTNIEQFIGLSVAFVPHPQKKRVAQSVRLLSK